MKGDVAEKTEPLQAKYLISEASLQATVVEIARTAGWIVWFTHDARKSEPGEPDLRMAHPVWKRYICAELKTLKGKFTTGRWNRANSRWLIGQDEAAEALKAIPGIEYYLWRPWDLDEIERVLQQSPPQGVESTDGATRGC